MKTQRCNQPTHTIHVCLPVFTIQINHLNVGKCTNHRPMMSVVGFPPNGPADPADPTGIPPKVVESDANMSTEMRLCAEMAWKP